MAQSADQGLPSFEGLLNFRDVAQLVNTAPTEATIKPGMLYRSARLDDTTPADRNKLLNTYRIKTVIDLRTKTEHLNAVKKHTEMVRLAQPAVVPLSNDLVATALKIPGIDYAEINLNGKGFERSLIWQLRYWSLTKMVGLMALGYRMEAISIIGSEVLQKRGLIGLGMDTLDHSGQEIREVFDVLARKESWPILIHCTQGKDRTGLMILLVLLLCNVPINAIAKDYLRTEIELEPEMEERMKEISSIGLDESFAHCPQEFPSRIQQHLKDTYGGIREYLTRIDVRQDQVDRIMSVLLNNSNHDATGALE